MRRLLSRGRAVAAAAMPTMSAMFAVHEDMQEGAGKDQQPGQPAEQVRAVFREEIKSRDCEEAVKGDVGRAETPPRVLVFMQLVSVCFHGASSDSLNTPMAPRYRSNVKASPQEGALLTPDDAATDVWNL